MLHSESELHQRASRWFEAEGFTAEAIEHALAARDWERPAKLIGLAADSYLKRGDNQGKRICMTYAMMNRQLSNRSSQRIFYLAAIFYIVAVFLRSILVCQHDPKLPSILGILLLWLVLFASETVIASRWLKYFPFYLALQTGLIFVLLYIGETIWSVPALVGMNPSVRRLAS